MKQFPGLEAFMPPPPGCPFCGAKPRRITPRNGQRTAGYQWDCGTWKPLSGGLGFASWSQLAQSVFCEERTHRGFCPSDYDVKELANAGYRPTQGEGE
jgi:hypothetical protein